MAGLSDAGISAVVAWYPLTDLRLLPPTAFDGTTRPRLFERREVDLPALMADASPITHITSSSPPCLLVHGDRDHALPAVHSERFHQALLAAGGESAFQIVPGADHCFESYRDVPGLVDDAVTYLQRELRRSA